MKFTKLCLLSGLVAWLPACASPTVAPTSAAAPVELMPAEQPPIDSQSHLEPDALVCAVRAANPSLQMFAERWRAERLGAEQVSSVEDTRVSYSFSPGSIVSRGAGFGQVITVEQSFQLGQTRIRERVASASARAAMHSAEARRNELERLSTTLLAEYYALVRALESNAEFEALARDTVGIVDAHYSNGHGTQQDPVAAELALTHVQHDRIVLESQIRVVRAQLNGLLHRPVDAELPPPPERLVLDEHGELVSESTRPELDRASAQIDAAREREALARRGHSPKLSANASYNSMWQHPAHRFMMGVGVSVPLQFRAIDADVARAGHERRAREHERETLADEFAVQVAVAREGLKEAVHVRELHLSRLLPRARERVEAARIAYENHEAPLRDLVDAERELRELELHMHRLDADILARSADLRFAAGVSTDCSRAKGGDDVGA